jgi:hypothetical protein
MSTSFTSTSTDLRPGAGVAVSFKSSSGVDSVVASSELGDDLAEAFGVLAQKG